MCRIGSTCSVRQGSRKQAGRKQARRVRGAWTGEFSAATSRCEKCSWHLALTLSSLIWHDIRICRYPLTCKPYLHPNILTCIYKLTRWTSLTKVKFNVNLHSWFEFSTSLLPWMHFPFALLAYYKYQYWETQPNTWWRYTYPVLAMKLFLSPHKGCPFP